MKDFQEEYYDNYNYDEEKDLKRIKILLKYLPKNSSKTLLDIGCSDGQISKKFLDLGYIVTGVDNSEKALELAKLKGIKTIKADILKRLPFSDDEFNLIFCGETLEHVLNPLHVAREAYRILKPGGKFLVTVPNVSSLGNCLLILSGSLPAHACTFDGPHVRDYSKKELQRLLSSAGFKKITHFGDKITIPIFPRTRIPFPKLANKWCDYLIAVCEK